MLSADNFQFFLEVLRTGRMTDAARRLQVDQTTVSRRIARLEKDLGTRLFDRSAGDWQLTDAGQQLVPYAEAIETTVVKASDMLVEARSNSGALSGTVRILASDGFGSYLLLPALAAIRRQHPNLTIEVLTSTTRNLLTGRDFDIGITLEEPPPRSVFVEKLADYQLKLYASKQYLAEHGTPETLEDLREHTVIWYIENLLDVEPLRIMNKHLPGIHAQVQTNNIAGHREAVRTGLGVAPLPTYIGTNLPDAAVVLNETFTATRSYWLVMPRELVRLARIVEVAKTIRAIAEQDPHLLAPTPPNGKRPLRRPTSSWYGPGSVEG